MATDKEGLQFMRELTDFSVLRDKSQQEVAAWANEMWSRLKASPYWSEADYYPFIQLFLRYMGQYIPEVQARIDEAVSIEPQQAESSA